MALVSFAALVPISLAMFLPASWAAVTQVFVATMSALPEGRRIIFVRLTAAVCRMTLKQLWCLWSGKRTMPRKPPRQQCNPPRPLALPIHCLKSETRLWSEYLHHACLSAETGERLHPCNWFSVNNQLEQLTNRSHSSAVLTRQLTNARTTSLGACVMDHTF